MNGGANRRFPRTARAMPEARPKIEREKIKHRRPNDLKVDDGGPPSAPRSQMALDVDGEAHAGDLRYEDAGVDWSGQDQNVADPSDWDDDSEDDWMLEGDDRESSGAGEDDVYIEEEDVHTEEEDEDEGGVIWEDDAPADQESFDRSGDIAFDRSSDITFDRQDQSFGFAPEVELAGRRDVRPKPPRPAPPPLPPASRQSPQRQRQQRQQPAGRRPEVDWPDYDEPAMQVAADEAVFEPPQHAAGAPANGGRFSRTRATMDPTAGAPAGGRDEQVLQPAMPGRSPRRRQAQPAPAALHAAGRRHPGPAGGRLGRTMIAALILLLIAGGGWLALRSAGSDGIQPLVDSMTALIPVPGSTRTAADTSFGDDQATTGTVSAEQALSDLTERVRQNGGDAAAEDPAAFRTEGPPIPKFKPLPGVTGSLPADAAIEETRLAANGSETGDDGARQPSIFEQLWRYLSPG